MIRFGLPVVLTHVHGTLNHNKVKFLGGICLIPPSYKFSLFIEVLYSDTVYYSPLIYCGYHSLGNFNNEFHYHSIAPR